MMIIFVIIAYCQNQGLHCVVIGDTDVWDLPACDGSHLQLQVK